MPASNPSPWWWDAYQQQTRPPTRPVDTSNPNYIPQPGVPQPVYAPGQTTNPTWGPPAPAPTTGSSIIASSISPPPPRPSNLYQPVQGDPNSVYRAGIVNQRIAAPAGVTGYDAQGYDAQGYNAQGYNAQGYTAQTGEAAQTDVTLREVQTNELVQNQINQIIDQNSPLIQMARARANEDMQRRGMLNSTMAMQAADAAVYDVARPIAEFDARVFGDVAAANHKYTNEIAMHNTDQENRMRATNLGFINKASEFNANAQNEATRFTAQETNTASRFNAQETNTATRFGANARNQANEFYANAQNQVELDVMRARNAAYANDAAAGNNAERDLARARNTMVDANLERAWDGQIREANGIEAERLQQMQAENEIAFNEIDQDNNQTVYKDQIITTAKDNITAILNGDLTDEAKERAIQWQIDMAKDSLAIMGISDEELAEINDLLDFWTYDSATDSDEADSSGGGSSGGGNSGGGGSSGGGNSGGGGRGGYGGAEDLAEGAF